MTGLRALRALARVEWRQRRAHPFRTALLVLLVAVPVAAVVGGATLARVTEPTLDEARRRALGGAALRVEGPEIPDDIERLATLLPAEAATTRLYVGREVVLVPGRRLRAQLLAAPRGALEAGGAAEGMLRVMAGRPPENSGEVALSPVLLDGVGRSLGDTVTLEYGPLRVITGVVVDPEERDAALVVRPPAAVEHGGAAVTLVTLPGGSAAADSASTTAALAGRLRSAGFTVRLRDEVTPESGGMAALVFALGLIGFFEAALVIAAAVAVGLTRRQHEIGLLGSTGAPGRLVALALIASTSLLALAGGVVGSVVGLGVAALVHPLVDGWNGRLNGPFEVAPVHLLGAILLGVATAALAAALPAARAVRLPIREALGGRKPNPAPAHAWLAGGAALLAVAVALLLLAPRASGAAAGAAAVLGPILGVLGFGMTSPWLLGALARRVARFPVAWRLAIRDAGRFRGRNGPVVTAVLAGMSMSVTVAVLSASLERTIEAFPARYRDDQLLVAGPGAEEVVARIDSALAPIAVAPLFAVYAGGEPVRARFDGEQARPFLREWVATGDEALLAALGLESAREAFLAGRLVALDPAPAAERVALTRWRGGEPVLSLELHAVRSDQPVGAPRFLLHRDALDSLGLSAGPPLDASLIPWLVRLAEPVGGQTLEQARALATVPAGTSIDADRRHRRPAQTASTVILVLCLATGLLVLWAATALCAVESESELDLLHSVGAPPGLLRDYPAARSAWLALLGSLLALPAGWFTAAALVRAANFPMPLVFPWRDALLLLLGLPLVTFLGGRVAGRSAIAGAARVGRAPGAVHFSGARRRGLVVVLFLGFAPGVAASPGRIDAMPGSPSAPVIRWEPHVGRAFDGSPLRGELGRFVVPANRDRADGRTIELAFVRYRTTNPNPGPPIVYLAGGPGGSGVELAGPEATHPQRRLLEQRDVIGLDQRGTGLSRPNLVDVAVRLRLPLDRAPSRAEVVAALRRAVRRACDDPALAGVDLEAFTTEESAADVDDLRRALGLETVALYGASYGSHLGLAVLRRHAAGVERALLKNVEGPDDTWKLPSTSQGHLEALAADVAQDPAWRERMPDLVARVRSLLVKLEGSPAAARARLPDGSTAHVVVGADDLRGWAANALATVRSRAAIPSTLERFSAGDWTLLAEFAAAERHLDIPLLAILVDGASGASPERATRIVSELRDPANLLADALMAPLYPEVCREAPGGRPGDDFRAPFACDVPVLFVSGTLDVRTPPENVDALGPGFPRAAHVVVEQVGHESRELLSEEFRALAQAFVRGESVASCRIRLPREPFVPPPDP